jgi:hypothetical protein
MTMEGLRRIAIIALIIALALVLLVILGFAAYSIFVLVKWTRLVTLVDLAATPFASTGCTLGVTGRLTDGHGTFPLCG